MAPSHLPPEVAAVIFDKVELARDKLAFLAVCSSWRASVVKGVHTLDLTSSEEAPPAAVASLLAAFHHQHEAATSKATPSASPPHDVPTGSSTLTRIALHTGSFTHLSRDLLRAISRHTNLRSLAIGAEAELLVAPQDAPTADDYERLFSHCVHLQDVRFAGSLAWCHGAQPVSVAVALGWPGEVHRVSRRRAPHDPRLHPCGAELQDMEVPLRKPNLPRSLGGLQSLTHLHVGPNMFGSHSLTIVAQLPSLTSLAIPVDLGFPPSAIRSLTGLRSLDLQFSRLPCGRFSFPSSFRLLMRLKNLGLSGYVHAMTLNFEHLPANLEILRMDGCLCTDPVLTNLTHLTALTELHVRKCPDLLLQSSELSGLSLQLLDVNISSLQLRDSVAEDEDSVSAVMPPSLLQLRMSGLIRSLDGRSIIACHLRSHLQSLEVLHLTEVRSPVLVAPNTTILPALPKLVDLHVNCRFSLLDKDEGVRLEDKFPALRQLELTECGCYQSFDVHSEENAAVINGALVHPCITQLTLADFYFATVPPTCTCPDVCDIHPCDWQKKQQKEQATECIGVGCSNLKQLSLHRFKAATVTFCVPLPHLQSLCLVGCPNLHSVQPEGKALAQLFPSLEGIDVRDCGSWGKKEK